MFEPGGDTMRTAHDLVLQANAHVREIALQDADEAIRQADVLIDVREADEFAAGHLPGAVLVPRGLLELKLSGTPALSGRDLKVVLYCKTSGRAALAAQTMQSMGYLNVTSIAGGFDAWTAAGKTVVKPDQPAFD
jgi:rhodanese-related sulfurtransferase